MDTKIIADAKEAVFWTTWRLQLTIPSVLAQDEEFCLRLTAFAPDGLPSDGFDREIVFTDSQGIEGLPKSVKLSSSDGGHLIIDGLRAEGPSHAVVVAKPEGCPSTVSSNPAWVFEEPEYRIYWGDLHVHTAYSNCSPWACKDPEFCYAYARDATYLDFAAPADHLHGIAADESRWPRLQELVKQYDSPGRFVPFLAFESSHRSGSGGDNNAYFLGADAPYFWIEHDDMSSTAPEIHLRELWEFLDAAGQEYFTIPHHTGRAGKYRSFADDTYDPAREPLLEIYSLWGSSECRWNHFPLYAGNADGPCYFQDVLRAGCRYGVIASSDDHTTLPGGESKECQPAGPKWLGSYMHKGLAAVRASQLTRDSLWKAMRQRRCYATTFERTLLDVRIGDLSMGQEGAIGRSDPLRKGREAQVDVLPAGRGWLDIVLLRNSEEIARERWTPDTPEIVFRDEAPLEGVALTDAPFHPDPFVVYYVRVENQFSETQWSSPIWLDVTH